MTRPAIGLLLLIALLGAACSASDGEGEVPATSTSTTVATASGTDVIDVPDVLADHDLDMVVVGERLMLLAIADDPSLRAQGLMGVPDLGDLDGMLFYWRHVAHGGFWMKDTLIPLDIVWFLEDGTYAGRASMEPCETEDDCPLHTPGEGIDYRLAIEARRGDLDWIDEDTVIDYAD